MATAKSLSILLTYKVKVISRWYIYIYICRHKYKQIYKWNKNITYNSRKVSREFELFEKVHNAKTKGHQDHAEEEYVRERLATIASHYTTKFGTLGLGYD